MHFTGRVFRGSLALAAIFSLGVGMQLSPLGAQGAGPYCEHPVGLGEFPGYTVVTVSPGGGATVPNPIQAAIETLYGPQGAPQNAIILASPGTYFGGIEIVTGGFSPTRMSVLTSLRISAFTSPG